MLQKYKMWDKEQNIFNQHCKCFNEMLGKECVDYVIGGNRVYG